MLGGLTGQRHDGWGCIKPAAAHLEVQHLLLQLCQQPLIAHQGPSKLLRQGMAGAGAALRPGAAAAATGTGVAGQHRSPGIGGTALGQQGLEARHLGLQGRILLLQL